MITKTFLKPTAPYGGSMLRFCLDSGVDTKAIASPGNLEGSSTMLVFEQILASFLNASVEKGARCIDQTK